MASIARELAEVWKQANSVTYPPRYEAAKGKGRIKAHILARAMGPLILLDKSALQSLSKEEIIFLYKHYFVVIAPILISEILGDLAKEKKSEIISHDIVRILASKMESHDSAINTNCRRMWLGELLYGSKVSMKGQVIREGGTRVIDGEGKPGIIFDEEPERKYIRRWQSGDFSQSDRDLSTLWRKLLEKINLETMRARLKEKTGDIPKIVTLNELKIFTEEKLLKKGSHQSLSEFMDYAGFSASERDRVYKRWWAASCPRLECFSPYSAFCFKTFYLFSIGLVAGLVTTRNTNWIDIEYLYYLPFCMAFSSGDNLHRDLSPLLLRADQDFLHRDQLKADLSGIVKHKASLSEEELKVYARERGAYPPEIDGSVTSTLWKKHMRPWKPGSGLLELTEEQKQGIIAKIRPAIEQFKKIKGEP